MVQLLLPSSDRSHAELSDKDDEDPDGTLKREGPAGREEKRLNRAFGRRSRSGSSRDQSSLETKRPTSKEELETKNSPLPGDAKYTNESSLPPPRTPHYRGLTRDRSFASRARAFFVRKEGTGTEATRDVLGCRSSPNLRPNIDAATSEAKLISQEPRRRSASSFFGKQRIIARTSPADPSFHFTSGNGSGVAAVQVRSPYGRIVSGLVTALPVDTGLGTATPTLESDAGVDSNRGSDTLPGSGFGRLSPLYGIKHVFGSVRRKSSSDETRSPDSKQGRLETEVEEKFQCKTKKRSGSTSANGSFERRSSLQHWTSKSGGDRRLSLFSSPTARRVTSPIAAHTKASVQVEPTAEVNDRQHIRFSARAWTYRREPTSHVPKTHGSTPIVRSEAGIHTSPEGSPATKRFGRTSTSSDPGSCAPPQPSRSNKTGVQQPGKSFCEPLRGSELSPDMKHANDSCVSELIRLTSMQSGTRFEEPVLTDPRTEGHQTLSWPSTRGSKYQSRKRTGMSTTPDNDESPSPSRTSDPESPRVDVRKNPKSQLHPRKPLGWIRKRTSESSPVNTDQCVQVSSPDSNASEAKEPQSAMSRYISQNRDKSRMELESEIATAAGQEVAKRLMHLAHEAANAARVREVRSTNNAETSNFNTQQQVDSSAKQSKQSHPSSSQLPLVVSSSTSRESSEELAEDSEVNDPEHRKTESLPGRLRSLKRSLSFKKQSAVLSNLGDPNPSLTEPNALLTIGHNREESSSAPDVSQRCSNVCLAPAKLRRRLSARKKKPRREMGVKRTPSKFSVFGGKWHSLHDVEEPAGRGLATQRARVETRRCLSSREPTCASARFESKFSTLLLMPLYGRCLPRAPVRVLNSSPRLNASSVESCTRCILRYDSGISSAGSSLMGDIGVLKSVPTIGVDVRRASSPQLQASDSELLCISGLLLSSKLGLPSDGVVHGYADNVGHCTFLQVPHRSAVSLPTGSAQQPTFVRIEEVFADLHSPVLIASNYPHIMSGSDGKARRSQQQSLLVE